MSAKIQSSRGSQLMAYAVASLFVLGFFSQIGALTGPILAVWFVCTQNVRRGFLWMMALNLIPTLIFGWRKIPLTGAMPVLHYLAWTLFVAVFSVLPFTFHRIVGPCLSGVLSTLPLPLAAVALPSLVLAILPGAASIPTAESILILWFAAVVVWLWNRESHIAGYAFAAGIIAAGGFALYRHFLGAALPVNMQIGGVFVWTCIGVALLLSLWAIFHPIKQIPWAARPEAVASLRSPFTGEPLQVITQRGREELVSKSGEHFSIRDGIPVFLKPEDLSGDNGKYNQLYQTIAGFYDDTQRVAAAIKGMDLDSYFLASMSLLEVRPGDSVLETSVGTGLNFKYLPSGVKLAGLDLSPEMLANCQRNLRRWKMEADLYLGNAESLPFADSSFDVVFHAGGINFFNDRAKAIREMIRVAKPGRLLLITDETEEYVKSTYEKIPYTSSFFGDRKKVVTTPIDLVPPEMEEIHLEMIKQDQFYVITFRKPTVS
ncbi:MAG: methyltransferase domain-containing protein [Terracidiphilus sp.]